MPIDPALASDASHLAGALLVGAMIGAQREATPGDHPGLRDFLLIGFAGGVCGLLSNPMLDAAALLSITAVLTVFHFEDRAQRSGITTELAGIATFVLALLASSSAIRLGGSIAIAVSILIAIFLETKQRLQHLLRETITEREFNATLGFVTTVLVIYPLLPPESYGPYGFFSPRQVWMFVILISSISYLGYFLEKFLGEEKGLVYTAILGGLASTTAATLHLARLSKERPGETLDLTRGFLIANSVQFPRAFLIVVLVNQDLAMACLWPLALTTLAGIVMAQIAAMLARRAKPAPVVAAEHGNPFRIRPALQFGALFTLVVFLSKVATARAGPQAFMGTSLLGGLVDVATVIAPASDLLKAQHIGVRTAEFAVVLALASNGVLKLVLAALQGTWAFTARITGAYLIWFLAAGIGLWIGLR